MPVSAACQEKENQERNKDSGKSKGWPKHHLAVRYCQRSCGMALWNFSLVHTCIFSCRTLTFPLHFSSPEPLLWSLNMLITQTSRYLSLIFQLWLCIYFIWMTHRFIYSILQQLYQTLSDFDIRFYMYEILKVRVKSLFSTFLVML